MRRNIARVLQLARAEAGWEKIENVLRDHIRLYVKGAGPKDFYVLRTCECVSWEQQRAIASLCCDGTDAVALLAELVDDHGDLESIRGRAAELLDGIAQQASIEQPEESKG